MINSLTPRELQVVRLIVIGYSNTQIAESLCVVFNGESACSINFRKVRGKEQSTSGSCSRLFIGDSAGRDNRGCQDL